MNFIDNLRIKYEIFKDGMTKKKAAAFIIIIILFILIFLILFDSSKEPYQNIKKDKADKIYNIELKHLDKYQKEKNKTRTNNW